MIYYRLKQGGRTLRWYPQYRRGDFALWNNFSKRPSFVTPDDAKSFLAAHSPKWEQYYEGEYPASKNSTTETNQF